MSFGISSLAVWALGPLVKVVGFTMLLAAMGGIALLTALTVLWLPTAVQLSAGERSLVGGDIGEPVGEPVGKPHTTGAAVVAS